MKPRRYLALSLVFTANQLSSLNSPASRLANRPPEAQPTSVPIGKQKGESSASALGIQRRGSTRSLTSAMHSKNTPVSPAEQRIAHRTPRVSPPGANPLHAHPPRVVVGLSVCSGSYSRELGVAGSPSFIQRRSEAHTSARTVSSIGPQNMVVNNTEYPGPNPRRRRIRGCRQPLFAPGLIRWLPE